MRNLKEIRNKRVQLDNEIKTRGLDILNKQIKILDDLGVTEYKIVEDRGHCPIHLMYCGNNKFRYFDDIIITIDDFTLNFWQDIIVNLESSVEKYIIELESSINDDMKMLS